MLRSKIVSALRVVTSDETKSLETHLYTHTLDDVVRSQLEIEERRKREIEKESDELMVYTEKELKKGLFNSYVPMYNVYNIHHILYVSVYTRMSLFPFATRTPRVTAHPFTVGQLFPSLLFHYDLFYIFIILRLLATDYLRFPVIII